MASPINGHGFEQAQGVGDGQGGLACCSPWGHKESDMTERLNGTEHLTHWNITRHKKEQNETGSFVEMGMDLESVMPSEVSQKE